MFDPDWLREVSRTAAQPALDAVSELIDGGAQDEILARIAAVVETAIRGAIRP